MGSPYTGSLSATGDGTIGDAPSTDPALTARGNAVGAVPGREGDVLTAEATEQALAGKTGVYDIKVVNQEGRTVALFRGKSHRVAGMVAEVPA